MKHVKLEYDEPTYAVIREAAYQARLPIKQFCQQTAAGAAAQATGLPVLSPAAPVAPGDVQNTPAGPLATQPFLVQFFAPHDGVSLAAVVWASDYEGAVHAYGRMLIKYEDLLEEDYRYEVGVGRLDGRLEGAPAVMATPEGRAGTLALRGNEIEVELD